jgi:hypothetical protein
MPENVVDVLETIEVETQHGETLVAAGRGLQRRLQTLRERRAVRQVGQGIVLREVGDAVLRPLAFGHVLDDAEQVLRSVVVAANDEPPGVDDARAVAGSLDCVLVVAFLAAFDQAPVAVRDEGCRPGGKNLVCRLADHLLARNAVITFAGAVDEHVFEVLRAPHHDRGRHALDHGIQERLRALQFALGAPPLGDVFMGADPVAAGKRSVDHRNGASVFRFDDEARRLAAPDHLDELGMIFVEIAIEAAYRNTVANDVLERAAGPDDLGREAVHFEIAIIANDQPLVLEHHHALRHVLQRGRETDVLLANAASKGGSEDRQQNANSACQDHQGQVVLARQPG